MNPRESFTLCGGGNESRVIPGTIRNDWTDNDRRFVICPEAGLGVRVAPFELSVHDRSLSLAGAGTITPLGSLEYQAWTQSRYSSTPINTAATTVNGNEQQQQDWRLRYLESEMSRTQSRMAVLFLLQERRRMQNQIMGLQAQLHEARTNNQLQIPTMLNVNDDGTCESLSDMEESDCDHESATPTDTDSSIDEEPDERETAPSEASIQQASIRVTQGCKESENESTVSATVTKTAPGDATNACGTCTDKTLKNSSLESHETQEQRMPSSTTRNKRKRSLDG